MKKITPYRLQYWLYAILAKKYGRQIHMERGFLHNRYEVNKHDFNVSGVVASSVEKFLKDYLKQLGFNEDGIFKSLSRKKELNGILVEEIVSIRLGKTYKGDEILIISSNVYKRKVQK